MIKVCKLFKILSFCWKLFLCFYTFVCFLAAIQKPDNLEILATINDKILHFTAFFFMAFLVHAAYPKLFSLTKFTIPISYGAILEITQYFIPYRSASIGDFLADAGGTLCFFYRRLPYEKATPCYNIN